MPFPAAGCTARLCVLASPAVGDVEPPPSCGVYLGHHLRVSLHTKPRRGQRPGLVFSGTAPRASRPRLVPPDPFPPNSHSLHRPTRAAGLMPFTAAGAGPGVAPAAPGSRPARAARGSRGERSTLQLPRLRLSHTALKTCKEWCKCKRRQAVRLRITRCAPRLCRSTHERKPRNNNRKA